MTGDKTYQGYHAFQDEEGREYGCFEVFWKENGDDHEAGWYWWACSPGCLPDGNEIGPFQSSRLAWADAREE